MAGLQSYVLGTQPSQPSQTTRTDRLLYATNAKVSARKPTLQPASAPQPFKSAVYAPEYTPNPAAPRNTYRPSWYPADQQPAITTQKGIFDDTISELDDTGSVIFDGRHDMSHNGPNSNEFARSEDDYEEVDTVVGDIEHLPERPTTPRGGGISGRFYQPPQGQTQHANMELRPHQNGTSTEQQLSGSKKRSRFAHPNNGVKTDEEEQPVKPGNFDVSSSGEESSSDSQNERQQKDQALDYDDQQLENMTYQKLKDETWESEKHGRTPALPQELKDPEISLEKRFQNCVKLDGDKEETQEIQVEFFAKLSTAEWEEAGDLFVGRFAEIMTKLKEARQAKRKIATDFEKKIEQREAAIREKSEKLDSDFAEMRKGGEGVIRGKVI